MSNLAKAVVHRGIMVAIGSVVIPDSLGLVYPIPYLWQDEWDAELGKGIVCDRDYVDIAVCAKCKKPYLIWMNQQWTCRNCGYYDGDSTYDTLILRERNSYKKFTYDEQDILVRNNHGGHNKDVSRD